MSEPFARIRVRREQAALLDDLLYRERGRLIEEKIVTREAGLDPTPMMRDLKIIKYLMEEMRRTFDDIELAELETLQFDE